MTDRPILFSEPMVRAILDGHKTQTRRITVQEVPHYEIGDRLYVRESCWIFGQWNQRGGERGAPKWCFSAKGQDVVFEDPGQDRLVRRHIAYWDQCPGYSRKPSIHMPRWASRLTLRVTDVRVQKLNQISESDARAEGVPGVNDFIELWNTLNEGRGHGWVTNPPVVALTFDVHNTNIDELEAT